MYLQITPAPEIYQQGFLIFSGGYVLKGGLTRIFDPVSKSMRLLGHRFFVVMTGS
jgi:hypothetical protein